MSRGHYHTAKIVGEILERKQKRIDTWKLKGDRLQAKEKESIDLEQSLIDAVRELIANSYEAHLGKLPPQALDLEEAVLGVIILESKALPLVIDFLKINHFYLDKHRTVYAAVLALHNAGDPVDMRSVVYKLRQVGKIELVGGPHAIAELTAKVSSAANIEFHARVLQEYSMRRALIRLATELTYSAFDDTVDVFDLFDGLAGRLKEIEVDHTRKRKTTSRVNGVNK